MKLHIGSRLHTVALTLIASLTILMTLEMFRTSGPLNSGDAANYLGIGAASARSMLSHKRLLAWYSPEFCGLPLFPHALSLVNLIPALFGDLIFGVKVVAFLSALLSGLFMYAYAFHATRKVGAALVSSFIYMLSQTMLTFGLKYSGHLDLAFGYALLPLCFLVFEIACSRGNLGMTATASMVTSVALMSSHPHVSFILLMFLGIYGIVAFAITSSRRKLSRTITTLTLFATLTTLFSLPLVALFFIGSSITKYRYPFALEDLYVNPSFADPITLRNFHTVVFNPGLRPEIAALDTLGLVYTYPLLAFAPLLLERDRRTLGMAFIAAISIFLSYGALQPFGFVNLWLFTHVYPFNTVRVPQRFMIITAFSYAFLIGRSLVALHNRVGSSTAIDTQFPRLRFSTWLRHRAYGVLVLFMLIFAALYSYNMLPYPYVFNSLEPDLVNSHSWVASQPGQFRVASIPLKMTWTLPMTERGYNTSGTVHPASYDMLLRGKEVLWGYGPGFELPQTGNFVDYLDRAYRQNQTSYFGKLLGLANVKYVIVYGGYWGPYQVQPITIEAEEARLMNQLDLRRVESSNASFPVFENLDWAERMSAVPSALLAVGDLDSDLLISLSYVDGFDYSRHAIVFSDQIRNLTSFLSKSNCVVFSYSGFMDLVKSRLDRKYTIDLQTLATPSLDSTRYWLAGEQRTVYTFGNSPLIVKYAVSDSDLFEIWLKLLYSDGAGTLSVSIDRLRWVSVLPYASFQKGYYWVRLGSVRLSAGIHEIELTNQNGKSSLKDMVVVSQSGIADKTLEISDQIRRSGAKSMYLLEAEKALDYKGFYPMKLVGASDGYVLHTKDHGNVSHTIFIPGDAVYWLDVRLRGKGTLLARLFGTEYEAPVSLEKMDWLSMGPFNTPPGSQEVILAVKGKLDIDELLLYPGTEGKNFTVESSPSSFFTSIDPEEYTVHVEANRSFWLVFGESYHSFWKAYVNGKEISSVPVSYFANGFYIDEAGSLDISVIFTGGEITRRAVLLSALSFSIVVFALAVNEVRTFVLRQRSHRQIQLHSCDEKNESFVKKVLNEFVDRESFGSSLNTEVTNI